MLSKTAKWISRGGTSKILYKQAKYNNGKKNVKTATKGTKKNLNKNSPEGNKNEAKRGKRKYP